MNWIFKTNLSNHLSLVAVERPWKVTQHAIIRWNILPCFPSSVPTVPIFLWFPTFFNPPIFSAFGASFSYLHVPYDHSIAMLSSIQPWYNQSNFQTFWQWLLICIYFLYQDSDDKNIWEVNLIYIESLVLKWIERRENEDKNATHRINGRGYENHMSGTQSFPRFKTSSVAL